MSLISEEGILLRAHRYSESSSILRFLTPGHGVLSVMARGVRRDTSKGKGAIETFDGATLVLAYRESRDLHTLRELEVTRSRRGLGRDLARFAGASLIAELLMAHTLQGSDPDLFDSVRATLDELESGEATHLVSVILAGAWTLLSRTGFPPELAACARCGSGLPDEGLLRFSVIQGGLLCARCGADAPGPRIGPGARGDLARLLGGERLPRLRGADAHLTLFESFALHHLAPRRGFRSVELLRPLVGRREGGDA